MLHVCDNLTMHDMVLLLHVICNQADMMIWDQCWIRVSATVQTNLRFISIMLVHLERLVSTRRVKDIFYWLLRKVEMTTPALLVIMLI